MPIRFACPSCKTAYRVNDQDAGKKSDCRVCGQRLQVPRPERSKTVLGEALPTSGPSGTPPVGRLEPGPRSARGQSPYARPHPPVAMHADPDDPEDDPEFNGGLSGYGYLPPVPKSRRWLVPAVGTRVLTTFQIPHHERKRIKPLLK